MDKSIFLWTIITLFSWGIGSFFDKLATNKIGERTLFFSFVSYSFFVILYCLFTYKFKNLLNSEKSGIGIAILAGLISTFGMIGFYKLLTRGEASSVIPLTALYPAVTAVLAFIFLRESITMTKILGIIFSLVAIYLLSK